MSNSYLGSPPIWIVDTASATNISTNPLMIKSLVWVSVSASAGDEAKVTDSAGNVIWDSFAPGADFVSDEKVFHDKGLYVNGLRVPTLTSGKVYVYLR